MNATPVNIRAFEAGDAPRVCEIYLPEAVGRGIAGQLYDTIERIAIERGLLRLTVHASLLAQPFFAKRGWKVEQHELYVKNGVEIPRAEMSKDL